MLLFVKCINNEGIIMIDNTDLSSLTWAIKQRFEFIELMLFWEGFLNRSNLSDQFKISTPQASSDIQKYLSLMPDNMIYNKNLKRYEISDSFNPVIYKPTHESLLNNIKLFHDKVIQNTPFSENIINIHEFIPTLERNIPIDKFKMIFDAIKFKKSLDISYQSLNDPEPILREVFPIKIVHNGSTWHFRAYCKLREGYRDFLFPRTLIVSSTNNTLDTFPEDAEWDTYVKLTIIPHKQLSKSQQQMIETDFQMESGKLILKIRKAFLFIFKRNYCFDIQDQVEPARQQIYLLSEEQL